MKSKVLLILILILSLVLTACAAVTIDEPNATDTKDASATSAVESTGEDTSGETTSGDTTEVETTGVEGPMEINPNQNYIGGWVSYPDIGSGSVYIWSVTSDSVLFSLTMTKGPSVKTTAIKQDGKYVFGEDISPDLEYSLYDGAFYGKVPVGGYLEFEDERVILKFNEGFEISEFIAEVKTENLYGKLEIAENDSKTTLESAGWSNIEIRAYDFSIKFDNAEPYSTERIPLHSVTGTTGDITAVIRVAYDRETDEWFTADAFYASTSGKVLQGKALETFMTDHGKTDFILSADDADLIEYFK